MKILGLILFLTSLAVAQSPRALHNENTLPDAPSVQPPSSTPFRQQSFTTRHRKLLIIGIPVAAGLGTALWVLTHRNNCAKFYDGKPYDGTPPCPKDGPGTMVLRWRF